mmetsp:Transcript_127946/g.239331  ORF Transcript_127946/g.239331 Transcript_127946/m.239331 type:complete len:518 (-) Transcript_127946:117-1670(-)
MAGTGESSSPEAERAADARERMVLTPERSRTGQSLWLYPAGGLSRSHSTLSLDSDPSLGSRPTSCERRELLRQSTPVKLQRGTALHLLAQALPGDGFYIDAHQLVLDRSVALDVFKGVLVVLQASSLVIITLGDKDVRVKSSLSLLVCNAAATHCFIGFLMAFGYSCYRQYLRDWPDPPRNLSRVRWRVLRAVASPVGGAWLCNFVWCFICYKQELTGWQFFEVLTFTRIFGTGPDFLLGFSINLTLVYMMWRPVTTMLNTIKPGTHPYTGWRRDAAILAIALSPLLFSFVSVPDCTGHWRWAQWLFVCDKRDVDTPSLPALPHLVDFNVGMLVAACWDRFVSHLRPVGDGGVSGGLHMLPFEDAKYWATTVAILAAVLLVFFIPLGQVWLYEDLVMADISTPFGHLARGFSGGPSALWLLSTMWPLAALSMASAILVMLRSAPYCAVLTWPLTWLEHLGANVLYYLIVVDLFTAGMYRGFLHFEPFPLDFRSSLACTALILAFGRFCHLLAKVARK